MQKNIFMSVCALKDSHIHSGDLIFMMAKNCNRKYRAKTLEFLPREATRSAVLPWQVVHLSVTLRYRDHIGWNSAKIISRLISLTISLSVHPNMTDLLQREHPQILAGI